MKIAYDLHGVLTEDPELYKTMMQEECYLGHEVWVISGPPKEQVESELIALEFQEGIHYNHIVGVVDFLIDAGHTHTIDKNGNYWFDEETWWMSKAEICRKHCISILHDNEEKYGRYFMSHRTTFYLVKHFSNKKSAQFKLTC